MHILFKDMLITSEQAEAFPIAQDKETSSNPNNNRPPLHATASVSEKSTHESSPTYVVVTEPLSLSSSLSVDHVPSLRVRSEELQRSISSPQVCEHHFD